MILIVLLYLCSLLLLWQFLGYPLLMGYLGKKYTNILKDYSYQPYISILVATYNEERVIQQRIENLLSIQYNPENYEIIIIDSASYDSTQLLIEKILQHHGDNLPPISLIKEKNRKGKSSALNLGIAHAKGDIILIADANSIYEKNILKEMAPLFKNPEVGAVSGRYYSINNSNEITQQEGLYWDIENLIFSGESYLDSIATVIGTISAWKKNLVHFSSDIITEDLDMTVQIRKRGYKIMYEPRAIVSEPAALSINDQIIQRKRTSLGTIQTFFKHIWYFIPPKNIFSAFIFPSHKMLMMFSPFILFAIGILYLIIGDINIILLNITFTTIFFIFLLFVLLSLKSANSLEKNSKFSISSIPRLIQYVLLNEYIILLAWKDFFCGNNNILWEKTESSRPEVTK